MKTIPLNEIMIPLSEYAIVAADATLQDAVLALKEAQEKFQKNPHHHRSVLVIDPEGRIVGKISQLDLIKGLEDGYKKFENVGGVVHFGYDPNFIKKMMDRGRLWERPLADLCRKSARIKAKDIMNAPTEGEFVASDSSLDEAIHQMVVTRHHSLLVTENGQIAGVLRLVDIFEKVAREMSECKQAE